MMGLAADRIGNVTAFAASGGLELAAAALCLGVADLRTARLP
jgi:hypothetical protein